MLIIVLDSAFMLEEKYSLINGVKRGPNPRLKNTPSSETDTNGTQLVYGISYWSSIVK